MPVGIDLSIEIGKIKQSLQAEVIEGKSLLHDKVTHIYASDLMSDVLAYGKEGSCLLTGLNTIQAAISSHMADFKAIVFLRGKRPTPDICKFARERKLVVLSTEFDMYEACVRIAGLNGKEFVVQETASSATHVENHTSYDFFIDGQDFASAGMVSTRIKAILKEIGYDMQLIRRIAISIYEGEMNVVMHALRARVTLTVSPIEINIIIDDEGKGIPDIEKAMQPGFSTATEEQRAMGFGAGMGLPNIAKNTDNFKITSEVGKGTRLELSFLVGS